MHFSREESAPLMDEKALSDLDVESICSESTSSSRQPSHASLDLPKLRSWLPAHLRSTLWTTLLFLLPSFIYSRFKQDRLPSKKLAPTAYLDGMRGVAALFVFFCHLSYTCFIITIGYGYVGEEGEFRSIMHLPIIRLLYSGPPMVCVFFIISGYALSLKSIKQMRSQSYEALLTTLSSSVFRRGMRLFIPTFASCFLVFCLVRWGAYEVTRPIATDINMHRNVREPHTPHLETFHEQAVDYIWQMFRFVCVFDWTNFAGSTGYDLHLWTIPVEFRASLFLFLTLVGVARLKAWARLSCLVALTAFVFRKDRWEMVLFYTGTLLAELDQIAPITSKIQSKASTMFWTIAAIVGLYLMSQPDAHFDVTPGWVSLSAQIPRWVSDKYRYWQVIGSIIFVTSCTRLPLLQEPFNLAPIQYLGKISYALYLMHGPWMHAYGYRVEAFFWRFTGITTQRGYTMGFVLSAMINVPMVIWAADVFWRAVDAPSVKLARWIENTLLEENKTKHLPQ